MRALRSCRGVQQPSYLSPHDLPVPALEPRAILALICPRGVEERTVPRVLVVDDSSSIRKLLGQRLRAHGHLVDEATDAETAFELATANPPEVVVTDLVMKGLSGVQLCRLLRNDPATAHIPVVLLTASGDKRSRFWARSAGAAAYVGKDRVEDIITILPSLSSIARAQTTATGSAQGTGRRIL